MVLSLIMLRAAFLRDLKRGLLADAEQVWGFAELLAASRHTRVQRPRLEDPSSRREHRTTHTARSQHGLPDAEDRRVQDTGTELEPASGMIGNTKQ